MFSAQYPNLSKRIWTPVFGQLHDGLKKLNVKPTIMLLPEDYDEITNNRLSPENLIMQNFHINLRNQTLNLLT